MKICECNRFSFVVQDVDSCRHRWIFLGRGSREPFAVLSLCLDLIESLCWIVSLDRCKRTTVD